MSRARMLAKQYAIAVTRMLRGQAPVDEKLVSVRRRVRMVKQERDLVWIEVELAWFGLSPEAFLYKQFSLEDSEGYLVAADPPEAYLDFVLEPGEKNVGGLLFGLYHDVKPVRLWFDTGKAFDDSGDPLMIEVPLDPRRAATSEDWAEQAARDLDREYSTRFRAQPASQRTELLGLVDVDAMLERVSRTLGLPFKRLANGYMFRVSLPDGRKQSVLMSFSGRDEEGSPLIKFVTLCAPADDGGANCELFLRTNPRLSYGAIGIAEIDGRDFYVMTATQLIETADPEELIKSITYLARRGDELEAQLTGGEDLR